MMLTGDNGILQRAGEAKELTGIAEIEEALRLEYLNLLSEQYTGKERATFEKAINNYNTNNPTKPQVTSESISELIEIDKVELSSTNIQIGVESEGNSNVKTVEVTVIPKQNSEMKHYVTINGKKYEVKESNRNINIDRIATNSTGKEITIEAEVTDSTIAIASVSGSTITITGKLVAGSTKLNIKVNGTSYNEIGTITAKAILKPGDTAVATEIDNYVDAKGKTATVPKGFTVSNERGTTEGKNDETLIENGLVIKKGSDTEGWDEYVWIEVPRSIYTDSRYTTELIANEQGKKEVTSDTDYDGIYKVLNQYAYTYREGRAEQGKYWKDEWYDYNDKKASDSEADLTDTRGCGLTSENYIKQYQRMLKSVYTNGGFWIGRYEASSGSTAPLSQSGKTPKVYISCSNAQKEAAKVATSDLANNADSANYTSSLIFGIQWDLVCKFLEGSNEWAITESTPASWYINTDSSSWGVYSKDGSSDTGSSTSPITKRRNIYDFAGNIREWTLEHATAITGYPCGLRGGAYYYNGLSHPASHRDYEDPSMMLKTCGFRVTLY